jgi:hypothetical protein
LNKEKLKKLFEKWIDLQEQQEKLNKELDEAAKE